MFKTYLHILNAIKGSGELLPNKPIVIPNKVFINTVEWTSYLKASVHFEARINSNETRHHVGSQVAIFVPITDLKAQHSSVNKFLLCIEHKME